MQPVFDFGFASEFCFGRAVVLTETLKVARFREKVEVLGPVLSLSQLQSAIATQCVERLAAMWDERYGELEKFVVENGHCNVPKRWPDNPQLGRWVQTQRKGRTKAQLSPERIVRLEALGIVWDPLSAVWEEMFAALQDFKSKHGHCNVPHLWSNNRQLGKWVQTQRARRKQARLSPERIARLRVLGFTWDPLGAAWEEMFAALQDFKSTHGHSEVPVAWPDNPRLGRWVHRQRTAKRRGQLIPERIARLEILGFVWNQLSH